MRFKLANFLEQFKNRKLRLRFDKYKNFSGRKYLFIQYKYSSRHDNLHKQTLSMETMARGQKVL